MDFTDNSIFKSGLRMLSNKMCAFISFLKCFLVKRKNNLQSLYKTMYKLNECRLELAKYELILLFLLFTFILLNLSCSKSLNTICIGTLTHSNLNTHFHTHTESGTSHHSHKCLKEREVTSLTKPTPHPPQNNHLLGGSEMEKKKNSNLVFQTKRGKYLKGQ